MHQMETQPMRAASLVQVFLLERWANLLPRLASQSHFESRALRSLEAPAQAREISQARIRELPDGYVQHLLAANIRGRSTKSPERATQ
jgi:hypothetical protein